MTAAQLAVFLVGAIVGAGINYACTRHHLEEVIGTCMRLRRELFHRRGCPLCGDNDGEVRER